MKLAGLSGGLIAAILSSLCCITPVIALLAGTSSIAASVSWLEPARPYLAGITFLVLGMAWYQQFRNKRPVADCECDQSIERKSFIRSKTFLGIITVFALLMLSFPYYAGAFFPRQTLQVSAIDNAHIKRVEFRIDGMTCPACEEHVTHQVSKLTGIIESKVSYKLGNAVVSFDELHTNISDIENAINMTGYKVIEVLP